MRRKSEELKRKIIDFINNFYQQESVVPTVRKIASALNVSKSCISSYIQVMKKEGELDKNEGWYGIRTKEMSKIDNFTYLPIVGTIACGPMLLAEQNIERYIPIPKDWLGKGKYFGLIAKGDSMINVGISNGDIVVIKIQNTAEEGQIVIARADDEATLKRYYIDNKRKKIRLHPENDSMKDMFFDNIEIQGIAVKVVKDLL